MMMLDGLVIVSLMTIAGALGTAASTTPNKEERTWVTFRWNCLIRIGASFLIPIFLATVSSKVLDPITGSHKSATWDECLVFVGFFGLGAISARHLITTLSEQVLLYIGSSMEIIDAR